MTTKFPIQIPAPLHMLIALSWRGGFKLFTFILENIHIIKNTNKEPEWLLKYFSFETK
jgi:hypothetical protein